jgi:hypothetical protein
MVLAPLKSSLRGAGKITRAFGKEAAAMSDSKPATGKSSEPKAQPKPAASTLRKLLDGEGVSLADRLYPHLVQNRKKLEEKR